MKLAASLAATVAFVSLFEPILSESDPDDDTFKGEEPKCEPGEVAEHSWEYGWYCTKPLVNTHIRCKGKEAGECERLCKETEDPKVC